MSVNYNDISTTDQVDLMLRRPDGEQEDDTRIGIIRLRLMQSNSQEVSDGDAAAGQYWLDGYGVVDTPLKVYPLGQQPGRTYFDKDTRDILCRSANGRVGIVTEDGEEGTGYGGDCSPCPMSSWNPKPACTEHIDIAMQLPDYNVLAVYRFASTHIRIAELINTHRHMHGWGLFAEHLSSIEATRNKFRFFKPRISLIGTRASLDEPFPMDVTETNTVEGEATIVN